MVDSRLLLELSYALQYEMVTTLTKEQSEMVEKLDSMYSGMLFEYETGLPAIARSFPPADGSGANIPSEWGKEPDRQR